jgi:alkanesulfonate monooxygenase SsuD/methylene tetrahydromethanopterin reductase-like flavin-dependent oxidoreductase (luciferase family)
MRLVARYADACNILVPDPGESRALLERLRGYCEEEGRAFEEIETTSLVEADLRVGRQSPAEVVRSIRAQGDEGITHVIVNMPEVWDLRHLAAFEREIIPAVSGG